MEIKFRAWDKKSKTMHYDYAINNLSDGGINVAFFHESSPLYNAEWELMQYIRLKDKNAKDIYEGDIYLATRSYMPSRGYKKKGYPQKITVICVVEWSIYDAGWRDREISPIKEHIVFDKSAPYHYYQTSLSGAPTGHADWIEVVGNIHENPELLQSL